MVYQGGKNSSLINLINELSNLVVGIEPDLTLIIDIDPQKSLNRGLERVSKENRFEMFGLEFQKNAKLKYKTLAKENNRCRLIDGNDSKQITHKYIWNIVSNQLKLNS